MCEPSPRGGAAGQSPKKHPLACQASVKTRNSAKRVLFGRPSREETNNWLEELEDNCVTEKSQRWGFDFQRNRPLEPTSSSGPPPSIAYERVDEKDVPHVYRSVDFACRRSGDGRANTNNSRPNGVANPPIDGRRSPRKHIVAQHTCPLSPRKSTRQSSSQAKRASPTKKKKRKE